MLGLRQSVFIEKQSTVHLIKKGNENSWFNKGSKMMEKKIIFIILHYMAVETTFECVEYIIKNIDTDNYQIVIVDNNSPDNSYILLQKRYRKNEYIDLIHNEGNTSFSGGNNYGIHYVNRKYKYNFLILMNNDTLLLETAFYEKIKKYYEQYKFAVAGPRIINKYGADVNMTEDQLETEEQIKRYMIWLKKMLILDKIHLMVIYYFFVMQIRKLENCLKNIIKKNDQPMCVKLVKKDVMLHGCFWIFSEKFFEKYDMLIEKKAFYKEEDTLLYKLREKGLLTVYLPDILVIHLEDVSTNVKYRGLRERLRFMYENALETRKEYLSMLHNERESINRLNHRE